MGYQGILFDLRSGDGPYLKTLTELLGTNSDDRAKIIKEIRTLSNTQLNIMDFADNVIKLQSATAPGAAAAPAQIVMPTGPSIYSGDELEKALHHLTRGMSVTVYTKGGMRVTGQFEDYNAKRLWLKDTARKSFLLDEILAIDAPRL